MKDDSHVWSVEDFLNAQDTPKPPKRSFKLPKKAKKAKGKPISTSPKTVHLKISFSMPNWRAFFRRLSKIGLFRKHRYFYASSALGVVLVITGLTIVITKHRGQSVDTQGVKSAQTTQTEATFNTLLPENAFKRNIQPRYNAERNTVSFVDNYKGASLTVSQQQAPKAADLNKIAEGTAGIKQSITTTKGQAIVATEPISQQQTVAFIDNGVLVFIRTPKLLQEPDWIEYVSKMKPN